MNSETITLNECANDGTKIHLYFSTETGLWNSFGFSAFSLHLLAGENNIDCIESFSTQSQMPVVSINKAGLEIIMSKCGLLKEKHDSYIKIHDTDCIDQERYRDWTIGLRI